MLFELLFTIKAEMYSITLLTVEGFARLPAAILGCSKFLQGFISRHSIMQTS